MTVKHQGDTKPVDSSVINEVAVYNDLNANTLAKTCEHLYKEACNTYREYIEHGTPLTENDDRLFIRVDNSEWEAIIEHFEMPYDQGEQIKVDNPSEYYEGVRQCFNTQLVDHKVWCDSVTDVHLSDHFDKGDTMILPKYKHYEYELEME